MFATQRKSALVRPGAVHPDAGVLPPPRAAQAGAARAGDHGDDRGSCRPGVIHGVISQFTAPGATHVATVSDRTADYDAVRPDVWSHLPSAGATAAMTRLTYRVLDSEILGPLVEIGVLGLAAYLMIGCLARCASRARRRRGVTHGGPRWPSSGSRRGSACSSRSILYDFLGFPHGAVHVPLLSPGWSSAVIRPGAHGGCAARPPRRPERHDAPRAVAAPAPSRRAHSGRAVDGRNDAREVRWRRARVGIDTVGIGIRIRKLWHLKIGVHRSASRLGALRRGLEHRQDQRLPARAGAPVARDGDRRDPRVVDTPDSMMIDLRQDTYSIAGLRTVPCCWATSWRAPGRGEDRRARAHSRCSSCASRRRSRPSRRRLRRTRRTPGTSATSSSQPISTGLRSRPTRRCRCSTSTRRRRPPRARPRSRTPRSDRAEGVPGPLAANRARRPRIRSARSAGPRHRNRDQPGRSTAGRRCWPSC